MLTDAEKKKLPTLKRNLHENVNMLNDTIRGVVGEIEDFAERGKGVARHTQHTYHSSVTSKFDNSI